MCDAIEAYMAGESPMSDDDFRRLVSCHVMLDERDGPKGKNQENNDATAKVVANAFEAFDQVMGEYRACCYGTNVLLCQRRLQRE